MTQKDLEQFHSDPYEGKDPEKDQCPKAIENRKTGKLIKNCQCQGCQSYVRSLREKVGQAKQTEAPKMPIDEGRRSFVKWALGLAGATAIGGGAAVLWPVEPGQKPAERDKKETNVQFVLDDSWGLFAEKNGTSIEQIAESILPICTKVEPELQKYYPPLPAGVKIRIVYKPAEVKNGIMRIACTPVKLRTTGRASGGQMDLSWAEDPFHNPTIELNGISVIDLAPVPHELTHVFNNMLGVGHLRFFNEGLATTFEKMINAKFSLPGVPDGALAEYIDVFPELKQFPLQSHGISSESSQGTWDTWGQMYSLLAADFFQTYERNHPGFLKKLTQALSEASTEKMAHEKKFLTLREIVAAVEKVSPGFEEYFLMHPNAHFVENRAQQRFLIRQKGKKIFTVLIRYGIRKGRLGDSNIWHEFPDLLPPTPVFMTAYDKEGKPVWNSVWDTPFGEIDLNDIEERYHATNKKNISIKTIRIIDEHHQLIENFEIK